MSCHPTLRPLVLAVTLALSAEQAFATPATFFDFPATGAAALASRTVSVTNCNDSGPGSLRAAYSTALDGDVIDLGALQCSVITLSSELSDPPSASYVSVRGQDTHTIGGRIVVDAAKHGRAFVHTGGGKLTLAYVTVRNGYHAGTGPASGGCIFSANNLTLEEVAVSSCTAKSLDSSLARGGGAYAAQEMVLATSTVSDSSVYSLATINTSGSNSQGGGVWAQSLGLSSSRISGNTASSGPGKYFSAGGGVFAARLLAIGSTISGNLADTGGGIYRPFYRTNSWSLINSTVSGNTAHAFAGGIYVQGDGFVYNSTVARNVTLRDEVGGASFANKITIVSSILADNTQGPGGTPGDLDVFEHVVDGSGNLIGTFNGVVPPDTITDDPKLEPLQLNGGLNETHALLSGSPAIDRGSNPLGLLADERGHRRVENGIVDIGAFEFVDAIFANGFGP